MKKIYLLISSILSLGLTSCFDLEQEPQGELSTVGAFKTTGEITMYLNMFYEGSIPYSGSSSKVSNTVIKSQPVGMSNSGIAFGDAQSDNLCSSTVDTRLMGQSTLSGATVLNDYKPIRNLNFLLQNIENCEDKGSAYEQCLGEAYYFRAAFYYHLLVNYGGVTWTEQLLDPDAGQMKLPRDTRTALTDYILADLDKAIENLNEQSTNSTMRVHKDVARALKSEVALFAATWEKYHFQKQTPFYDHALENRDSKIADWLDQSIKAAKDVIDRGVWQIYNTGKTNEDYRDMFIDVDLSDNQEVLWWKRYEPSFNIGHSVTKYIAAGGGQIGVSASLVDDYLNLDGTVFTSADKQAVITAPDYKYGDELKNRDPRLAQTVCLPGQSMGSGSVYTYPPLGRSDYNLNTTGYSILKYLETNSTNPNIWSDDGQSMAPAIQVRYADVLLNYAEALAEQNGAANAAAIQDALAPLRSRVGMSGVDFDKEYNQDADYPFRDLDKYIQAVRRERRVEKALENCRLTDILRWAAADVLIKGKTPIGAVYGTDLQENCKDSEGKPLKEGENIWLTGNEGDALRYLIPFNNTSYPNGWQFNENRDYLLPIRQDMVSPTGLTGGLWEQNPGW